MDTEILKVDGINVTKEELAPAAEILRAGGLVAFPTETVYGLGADALDEKAAKRIYAAKGRPSDNPLIVHIANVDSLKELAVDIPECAYALAEKFWPGPMTMILKKRDCVPYGTTGGLDTVAIRMPNHRVALELIEASGVYVAAPSANSSGKPSPTKAKHVYDDLKDKIDMIVDGGDCKIGLESTIIDLTGETPMILRPGYITKRMLEEVVGEVAVDKVVLLREKQADIRPKAPGMKYKHYAPEGDLTIYEGNIENVVSNINQVAEQYFKEGKTVGIIATTETKDRYLFGEIKTIGTRERDESIAASLYSVLREFDEEKTEIILSESFYDDDLGQAIMNRLIKASGYKLVQV